MVETLVKTELDFANRQLDLLRAKKKEEQEEEQRRKNKGFTQVYPLGWKRVRALTKKSSGAASLYAFFAEHIDPSCGAVICDQEFLANQLEVTSRTIRTWLKFLEEEKAIVRIPVAGRVCAYALDPYEVWKGYNSSKDYAAFVTKTLTNKDGDIKRRLTSMFGREKSSSNVSANADG